MTRSDLIASLVGRQTGLSERDVELAVKAMLGQMAGALASGERIEIRGFGSFTLRYRPSRLGRNPRTGETIALEERYVPCFDRASHSATGSTPCRRSGNEPAGRHASRYLSGIRSLDETYTLREMN
jgi:integration host factor subunit beta